MCIRDSSTAVNRKVSHIESKLDHVKRLEARADDVEAMLELLSEDEDEGIAAECEQELESLSKDADASVSYTHLGRRIAARFSAASLHPSCWCW